MDEEASRITIETHTNIDDINESKVSLKRVHKIYKKWFKIRDTNRIDVVLATALSRKMEGTPLWLIIVSKSGDMKSEQIIALDDDGETTKLIHRFTDKTLVNGFPNKLKYPDLAPKLDGKITLIPDMAEILQLHPNMKSQVWAQMRDLYDGYAGVQSGMGSDINYKGLRITMIAASTPAIDEQILIHQSLGTRELIYRPKEIIDIDSLMDKTWHNEKFEKIMRMEIKAVTQRFLEFASIKEIEISDDATKQIKKLARFISIMRAPAPTDSYSGELRGYVHPEQPTRILKQLKKMFICLMSLDEKYTEEKALEIIKEISESSIDVSRQRIFNFLIESDKELSTSEIYENIKIGKKSIKTELNILWNLGLVNRREEELTNYNGYVYNTKEHWSVNNSNNLIHLFRKSSPNSNQITHFIK